MSATTQQVGLLHHTLGLRVDSRTPHRNHFVAGEGHHDMADLQALVDLGLMGRSPTPKFCDDGDILFHVTDEGKKLAIDLLPEEPKRTRYEEYLRSESNDSFGEHLCGYRLPCFESSHMGGYRWKYRMSRGSYYCDWHVSGEWCATKKDAKASYKAALAKFKALGSAT